MDLMRVQAFLVVADELHFGHAAERLGLSQPRVSRLVSALEREAGGALFERTTRQVRLTPLGTRLRDGWRPAYGQLLSTLDAVRAAARRPEGTLRIGFLLTTGGPALTPPGPRLHHRLPRLRCPATRNQPAGPVRAAAPR